MIERNPMENYQKADVKLKTETENKDRQNQKIISTKHYDDL